MACKYKNKTNKKSHRKNQVNKRVRQNLPHSLSLLATDNVGTFSRLRLLSLSCFSIFARRRKFQFLLGCFLSPSRHQLIQNLTLCICRSPVIVAPRGNRVRSQCVPRHSSFWAATIFRKKNSSFCYNYLLLSFWGPLSARGHYGRKMS